ncbi:MAG: filamentous hemagglutinin N-terminal protein, partial [Solimicrobium sp.]|nr:filamentous hemagglutinin N-terminal protein [Solimicrobium sp.]
MPRKQVSSSKNVTSEIIFSFDGGIYARDLYADGRFALINAGQFIGYTIDKISKTGTDTSSLNTIVTGTAVDKTKLGTSGPTSAASLKDRVTGVDKIPDVTGTTTASGESAISFNGLEIALPSNPNGYFVLSKEPDARFLIEKNPLFAVGSDYVKPDLLFSQYNYDPEEQQMHLGDYYFEAELIRRQLVDQINKNIITGYGNETDQIRRLVEQAVSEDKRLASQRLGFVYGTALTANQVASLQADIVWMVEATTVSGKRVLVPVVYLAASTRNNVERGAVIAAKNVNINVGSVTNEGGTIRGSSSLDIKANGYITNTSGTLSGGNVSLQSVAGSVINRTITTDGSLLASPRVVGNVGYNLLGKTATIQATKNLIVNA